MDDSATSPIGNADLERCEAEVESGARRMREALAEIRAGELYRHAGYETWGAYLKARWGISRSYAARQIAAHQLEALIMEPEPVWNPHNNVPASQLDAEYERHHQERMAVLTPEGKTSPPVVPESVLRELDPLRRQGKFIRNGRDELGRPTSSGPDWVMGYDHQGQRCLSSYQAIREVGERIFRGELGTAAAVRDEVKRIVALTEEAAAEGKDRFPDRRRLRREHHPGRTPGAVARRLEATVAFLQPVGGEVIARLPAAEKKGFVDRVAFLQRWAAEVLASPEAAEYQPAAPAGEVELPVALGGLFS